MQTRPEQGHSERFMPTAVRALSPAPHGPNISPAKSEQGKARGPTRRSNMQPVYNAAGDADGQRQAECDFLSRLPQQELQDLKALAHNSAYPSGIRLFSEKDPASGIYVVVEGEVKLSMNSAEGKRLILRIARRGEVLGLTSALSGRPCEMTAEVLYPA